MDATATFRTITCSDLHDVFKAGEADLVDVRTPVEFREVHSVYARNVPLDSLNPKAVMEGRGEKLDEPLYVICKSGARGKKACEAFVSAGFNNVVNVEGGTNAWDAAGLPVIRGKKAISLERQVRIAAGALVLTGVVLGHFNHEAWLGLSAFVGAGLVFAGITDTCGMGLLLAKMPWNEVKDKADSGQSCSIKPPAGGACCG